MTIAESLPDPRSGQTRQAGAARQAHEHRFDDVIQMVRGGDHPQAQRRPLLREEVQPSRPELGFGGETRFAPLADDAGDIKDGAQGLHESGVALGRFAPHPMVVVEDA